jgi:hypothetical protein
VVPLAGSADSARLGVTARGQVSNLNPTFPGRSLQLSPMSRPATHRFFRCNYHMTWRRSGKNRGVQAEGNACACKKRR